MKKIILSLALLFATILSFGQISAPNGTVTATTNNSGATAGNVGIGTSNPGVKLTNSGAVNVPNPTLGSGTFGANAILSYNGLYGLYTGVSNNGDVWQQVQRNDNIFSTYNLLLNPSGGNVGIGTIIPRATLDVASNISNGQLGTVFGRLPEGDETGQGTYLGVKGFTTQGVDFNNVKSFSIVHDFYGQTNSSINFYRGGGVLGGYMTFSTNDNTEKMRITTNGNVGIGTTTPDKKLTVNGTIHAKEIIVDTNITPDYVFQKYYTGKSALKSDYVMPTLAEIENFAKKNHHLPNVPSAREVQQNGVSLGTMSNVLLQKVEELTLYAIEQNKYAIEQNKKIMLQQEELERLKAENENYKSLAERLSSLEKALIKQ